MVDIDLLRVLCCARLKLANCSILKISCFCEIPITPDAGTVIRTTIVCGDNIIYSLISIAGISGGIRPKKHKKLFSLIIVLTRDTLLQLQSVESGCQMLMENILPLNAVIRIFILVI